MKLLRNFIGKLIAGFSAASAARQWPALPERCFVAGRAATDADVQRGTAAISFKENGRIIGEPIALQIPQYAYYTEGGKRVPVVVIQAEQFLDRQFIGARYPDGRHLVGFLEDFELLGREAPPNKSFKPNPLRGSA